jgi:hypothetical protein
MKGGHHKATPRNRETQSMEAKTQLTCTATLTGKRALVEGLDHPWFLTTRVKNWVISSRTQTDYEARYCPTRG